MSDKDSITKQYMQDNNIFADAFNFFLYNGRQVIKPEQLVSLDTSAIVLPYGDDGKTFPVHKFRDLLKECIAMRVNNVVYMILGAENQSEIHYAMPVRIMLYDSISYTEQVENTAKLHRKNKEKPETRAEFLSGFYSTDKLIPVITLTIYFGADEWTAPKSLHEMLSVTDDEILQFVPDYKLNLITPASIADEDFDKFHTELSQALKYIKYSKNKEKLNDIVNNDNAYKTISRKTADMINVMTGSKLHYNDEEESINMCKAIEDMRNDAIQEGRAKGRAEGEAKGIENTMLSNIKNLMSNMKWSLEQAFQALGISETEQDKYRKLIIQQ